MNGNSGARGMEDLRQLSERMKTRPERRQGKGSVGERGIEREMQECRE
jgi:hypothetical protein